MLINMLYDFFPATGCSGKNKRRLLPLDAQNCDKLG